MKNPSIVSIFYRIVAVTAFIGVVQLSAQEYYNPNSIVRNDNRIYDNNIKTVIVRNTGQNSMPVIDLGSDQKIVIKFDDLSGEIANYNFTVYHCDEHWEKTDMTFFEYASGMQVNFIDNYDYSRNTLQKYIHYQFTVPNADISLKVSGNYIIQVYRDNDPEKVVLTQRMMVVEQRAKLDMDIGLGDMPGGRFTHQELDFKLTFEDYGVGNPLQNLHLVLMQNRRWENAIEGLQPRFIHDNVLDYTYDGENSFPALNEYRMIDTRSLRMGTETTKGFFVRNDSNHTILETSTVPTKRRFRTTPDLNGSFGVATFDGFTSGDLDADYTLVHFELNAPKVSSNESIVLIGDAFTYASMEDRLLNYDQEKKLWEKDWYVKQGLTDFMYSIYDARNESFNSVPLEGSFSETENDYYILIYHDRLSDNYTRLVGYYEYEIGATR